MERQRDQSRSVNIFLDKESNILALNYRVNEAAPSCHIFSPRNRSGSQSRTPSPGLQGFLHFGVQVEAARPTKAGAAPASLYKDQFTRDIHNGPQAGPACVPGNLPRICLCPRAITLKRAFVKPATKQKMGWREGLKRMEYFFLKTHPNVSVLLFLHETDY